MYLIILSGLAVYAISRSSISFCDERVSSQLDYRGSCCVHPTLLTSSLKPIRATSFLTSLSGKSIDPLALPSKCQSDGPRLIQTLSSLVVSANHLV